MDITNELLRETALYLEPYFKANLPPAYEHRNFTTTVKLVQTCDLISVHTDLRKKDRMKILLAAWFQYTGFCTDPENYQKASVEFATRYFVEKGFNSEFTQEIEEFILATRYPQQPVTIQAQILCDAETSWLADKSFFRKLKLLRKEKVLESKKEIQDKDWLAENILMLENHIYFIPFSRKMFDKKKQKNKLRLQDKLTALDSYRKESQEALPLPETKEKFEPTLADDIKLERGVESLFRNTSRNQIHLIRLADYKANIIISINSIIISVILSLLVIRLDANKYLELPTLMLVLTNVATILIAISATRPKINMDSKDSEQLKDSGNNLLYFGNFYKMPYEEFNRVIKETIVDKNTLYESLSKDIYHQGMILLKKFKHINLSYTVFVIGLSLTILAFILSFLLHMYSI